MQLTLRVMEDSLAVCRLEAGQPLPGWFRPGPLASATWSNDELSLVCAEALVPLEEVQCEAGWRALALRGPFAFELVGILSATLVPLAQAGIAIFALSTYDTDYVLVKQARLAEAVDALRAAGHTVLD